MAVVLNEGYSCANKEKYLAKAEDCRVWDLQGNTYVDMAMAGGSAILGHADKSIIDAASSQFATGSLFTSPSLLAHQFCEAIAPSLAPLSEFVFSSTGRSNSEQLELREPQRVKRRSRSLAAVGTAHTTSYS